jgi:hypothetical protein
MYLTRCLNCRTTKVVAIRNVGREVVCRQCGVKYVAEVNEANNTPEMFVEHVRGRMVGVGEQLTLTGVIGILCALIALSVVGFQAATAFEDVQDRLSGLLLGVGLLAGSLLLSGVVTYGGTRMMRVRNYPLCVTAAVLAMLPFANPCCVGWVYGARALYWLSKPVVRRAFALNRPSADAD